jgi:hypothetical protein
MKRTISDDRANSIASAKPLSFLPEIVQPNAYSISIDLPYNSNIKEYESKGLY